jgi:hypothetical protein
MIWIVLQYCYASLDSEVVGVFNSEDEAYALSDELKDTRVEEWTI